jgi:hypothetical protein
MKRQQIIKRSSRRTEEVLDLRSPSGRSLPF